MTPELLNRIQRARDALSSAPTGILAGEIRPGASLPPGVLDRWPQLREFLMEADGGRFGSIDIWCFAELSSKQYPSADFPGEQDDWLIFGQLLYEPLALRKDSKAVHIFREDGEEPSSEKMEDFDHFFERSVLGPGYKEIIPDGEQDEWWAILNQAGLAT